LRALSGNRFGIRTLLDDFAIGMTAAVAYVALKHRFAQGLR